MIGLRRSISLHLLRLSKFFRRCVRGCCFGTSCRFQAYLIVKDPIKFHLRLIPCALNTVNTAIQSVHLLFKHFADHEDTGRDGRTGSQRGNPGQVIGDRQGESRALCNLAGLLRALGELDAARDCYERALELNRAISDREGEALCLQNLGLTYYDL